MAKRSTGSIIASGVTLRQDRYDDINLTVDQEEDQLMIEHDGYVYVDIGNVDLFIEAIKRAVNDAAKA